jgi:predicted GIY-YIG superfamily endonuclease
MVDYSTTVLYYCYNKDKLLYIGHTVNLKQRKYRHKTRLINENSYGYNFIFYKYIRENNINFSSDLTWVCEPITCVNKIEACKLEGSKIKELNPLCNQRLPGRTHAECIKIYAEKNKEKIKEWSKNYSNKIWCCNECDKTLKLSSKSRHIKRFHTN